MALKTPPVTSALPELTSRGSDLDPRERLSALLGGLQSQIEHLPAGWSLASQCGNLARRLYPPVTTNPLNMGTWNLGRALQALVQEARELIGEAEKTGEGSVADRAVLARATLSAVEVEIEVYCGAARLLLYDLVSRSN